MVLMMATQGGWTAVGWWSKTFKTKPNLKGDYQAQVHSGQMVLALVRQRLDRINSGQRCSRERQKMTLGSQGSYLITGTVTA
jgi:hypothetical protein